ncbi:MAG: O-antigen ligase family protein [Oleispira sp.]
MASLSLFLVTIILFFTQTRAAITASIISMGIFVFLYYRIKQTPLGPIFLFGMMCLISIGLTLYFINEEIFYRFSDLLNIQSWLSRLVSWQAAWESIKSAPIFGYGLGSSYQLFFEFIAQDTRLYSDARSFNYVHNEILQVWQEGGVFGLFIYLAFWFIPLVLAFRYVSNSSNCRESRLILLAIACALLSYHLHGLFSVAPRMLSCRIVAYSLLAILYGRLFQDKLGTHSDIKASMSRHVVPVCLILIFGGSLGYLILYAKSQSEYTGALVSHNKEEALVQLAKEYDDIYILDAAARDAFESEDAPKLLWITEKASRIFPNYRQMGIYQAYALYWLGKIELAIGVAQEFQRRDKYNKLANILLLSIALEQANQALWQQQLQIALDYQACIHKLLDCKNLKVNLVSGLFSLPLQIIEKSDKWTVLMDSKAISFLQRLKLQKAEDENLSKEKILQKIIFMLGQGQFFRPQILDPTYRLISADYEKLALYLRSENISSEEFSLSLDMYKQEAAGLDDFGSSLALFQSFQKDQEARQRLNQQVINELEAELSKTINIERFMATRKVLIGLSNTLLAALL